MIAVIDYRAGNLYNVANALRHLGVEFTFSSDPSEIAAAAAIILPGVGSARSAMESLQEQGLMDVLRRATVPFLGICLGLQLLYEFSEEEQTPCLGILKGGVRKFTGSSVKVPHIGWNQVTQVGLTKGNGSTLLEGIVDDCFFYFVHSYFAPIEEGRTVATTEYSVEFSSIVNHANFWGVQFHPERSGEPGLQLLRNFVGPVDSRNLHDSNREEVGDRKVRREAAGFPGEQPA